MSRRLGMACLLLGLLACQRLDCGTPGHLAELVSQQGPVQRDHAATLEQWKSARNGDRFEVGDGLRTGKNATAKLQLLPSGEIDVDSETVLRFNASAPGQSAPGVEVDIGSIEVSAAHGDLALQTLVGLVQIERNARVRVSGGEAGERVEVLLGTLAFEREGKRVEANAGEELVLDVGGITVSPAAESPPSVPERAVRDSAVDDATDNTGALDADAPDAGVGDAGVGPELEDQARELPSDALRADVTIGSGESLTIHDPLPPTRVRVPFTGCEHGGVLELARGKHFNYGKVRGRSAGVVRLRPGSYRYRVRCLPEQGVAQPIAEGRIRIVRDTARRRLPRRPLGVTVSADGRRYTLRYQNRLPQVTLRWPDAPQSERYLLHITTQAGRELEYRTPRPERRMPAGTLPEGTHSFRFETADGQHTSAGSVRIAFDNAASTAYLEGSAKPGPRERPATLSGAVLSRSSVSIGGVQVPLDPQGRFSVEAAPQPRHDAIALRVQHPATGVHYYLRRIAGAR